MSLAQQFLLSRSMYREHGIQWKAFLVAKKLDPYVLRLWVKRGTTIFLFSDGSAVRVIGKGKMHRIQLEGLLPSAVKSSLTQTEANRHVQTHP